MRKQTKIRIILVHISYIVWELDYSVLLNEWQRQWNKDKTKTENELQSNYRLPETIGEDVVRQLLSGLVVSLWEKFEISAVRGNDRIDAIKKYFKGL